MLDEKTKRPARPASPRLTGNRDWFITVECTADAVVLQLTGLKVPIRALATSGSNNALTETIRELIARRQASVRPGELAYRPQIRFLVHSDGLRSYYTAYPALEGLRIPMIRENLEPEK